MMSRTQITLDPDLQRRARQRAAKLGVRAVFDLGASGGANVARDKDAMVATAFASRPSRR